MAFTISPATSLSFWITGKQNTVNEGITDRDANFLYGAAAAFYNCNEIEPLERFTLFNSEDEPSFQAYWDADLPPFLRFEEPDGTVIGYDFMDQIGATDYYLYALDPDGALLSAYSQFDVIIQTYAETGALGSPDGTFESYADSAALNVDYGPDIGSIATAAGVLTLGNNPANAHTGDKYAINTAPGVPVGVDSWVISPQVSYSLDTNTEYILRAWINDRSSNPWTANGDTIGFTISGFTGATPLYEQRYTGSAAGRDKWTEIVLVFKTAADGTGEFGIQSDAAPQGSGIIWIDDLTAVKAKMYDEAVSETVCVQDNHPCTMLCRWDDSNESFGQYYSALNALYSNYARVPVDLGTWRIEDNAFNAEQRSDGTTEIVRATPTKVYTARFYDLPAYMLEKIILATRHLYFDIGGVRMTVIGGGSRPEINEKTLIGSVEIDLAVYSYDMERNNCT